MIGLVVDSNSQIPDELADRYGIVVVPLTVIIDGVEYLEGVDLDADQFYSAWGDGHVPVIEASQPSPGSFVSAYNQLIEDGATEILSIHVTESMSGTINAARVASRMVDARVRLVDSGTASFGIACCAWAAAEAIDAGADLETAAAVAEKRAAGLRTSFAVGVPQMVDRSGRAAGVEVEAVAAEGVPVLAMTGSDIVVLATATDIDTAVTAMVDDALAWPPSCNDGLRIAIGTSDSSSAPMAQALTAALSGDALVAEVVHYRIGPSIGAHTGPGTFGLFVF